MASVPGPPPSTREFGHSGIASVRLRRTSAKTGEPTKPGGGSTTAAGLLSASNQEVGNDYRRTRRNRQDSRCDELFTFKHPRREQLESSITIAALQENLSALTTFNQREKALSASLREEVARLTGELVKLNETRDEEKAEQEKNAAAQKQNTARDREERLFLPDIHGSSALVASTAALQQHTQMEVTHQRKMLSLENRCLHMMENNKKLLAKIQQFEKGKTEADDQLEALRQDNARLSSTAENLNSTISSQSAVIVGLRSTVQRLNRDEKLVENLRNSLERCQRELEAVKKREKLLQEEHAKLKAVASQEKEAMMSKILGFQQHLQRSDTVGGNVEVLERKLKKLLQEKGTLEVELEASSSRCSELQTRVAQLDTLSEEFVQIMRTMEMERAGVQAELDTSRQELEACTQKLMDAEARAQKAEARNASQQELTDLLQTREEEIATLMQKVMRLEDDLEERDQRYTGLQDEMHKVNTELEGLKQLSHDEIVQALQMARQKAATYEALTLLNEEKKALEEQLRLVQERLETERVSLKEERDAKEDMMTVLAANGLTIDELRTENKALLDQVENSRVPDKAEAEAATQTVEDPISPETHAQTVNELERATSEVTSLQSQLDELLDNQGELHKGNEDLRQSQERMEVGYKKLVSRERYKSESFQSQLILLQNENTELSEKMESLCKELIKEQQLNDAQTLEMTDLKQRVLSREAIHLLRKTQDSLEQTVNSLLEAEHASESTFTCLQCMQLFSQPTTLAPCGHTYCAACLAKCGSVDVPSSISCKMCGSANTRTECIFPNYALADLTARFIFRQQSLASLTTMCLSLRNSFTQRGPSSNSTANFPTAES
ncbi:hypothetical protein KRP22_001791 [Phytophthora ramorum]|nr:hypothetical protein KRP22_1073 [Phytophthora ramorum]